MRHLTRQFAALICAIALLGTACGNDNETVVLAEFEDVADLAVNASVKLSDVTVGRVTDITLSSDMLASVEMVVDGDIPLPADLLGQLRKTSVLGERYINLVPLSQGGSQFTSGGTIAMTEVIPELEEVVATTTDLLIAVSTDTLAGAIRSGADGLDGRGATLGQIIDDLNAVTTTYNANSQDLTRLLDGLDAFLDTVGPQAAMHGRALGEAEQFVRVLAEEDDRLIDTLVNLQALANTGEDIILTHRQRIDDFVFRLDAITDELVAPERLGALDSLFVNLAQHNFATIRGVNNEHAQVVLDVIACGVNDEPGDQVRSCDAPPQGRPRPEPRPPQDF